MTNYVVTLEGIAPPERADEVAFTKVRIEEGATAAGPWVVIDTQTIATGDPDSPTSVDVTVATATMLAGFYRTVWIDGSGAESTPSEPMQNLSQTTGGVRPTVREVAALLRARTKIKGGGEAGTFTAATRPTDDQVDDVLDEAEREVLGKVKAPEPDTPYEKRVRGTVALYAAILVELSYFPEQVGSDRSPLKAYEALYAKRIAALEAEAETGEVGGEGGAASTPRDPVWTFPEGPGLVGYQSRW